MKVSKGKLIKRIVIITLCVLIVLFCLASFFGVMYVYKDMFGRADIPEFTACLRYEDVKDEYSREDVEFESDGNTLQGHIRRYGKCKGACCDFSRTWRILGKLSFGNALFCG